MKTSMFDYCKVILTKVSFDKRLFWKEYRKSRGYLCANEFRELRQWVIDTYGHDRKYNVRQLSSAA
ncbi:MAG: hypothetical protein WBB45_10830 [Cyclobacteriaceae bacterium]